MNRKLRAMAVLVTALVTGVTGLAGCSHGPADRRSLCTEFDELGQELRVATGILANAVFTTAGDLADVARRYQGGGLGHDADALDRIADSDETNMLELENATAGTAAVCGHPLGLGKTSYADAGSGSPGHGGYVAPTTATASYPETPASNSAEPSDETSAKTALRQQADTDRAQAEALGERWVPQLSSKSFGLVADGTTYDYRAIWADFTTTRQAFPSVLLLWSGDYTSFTKGDFWVTVANMSFSSGAEANAWCVTEHLDADHCFAKLISHSRGPKGSTLPR